MAIGPESPFNEEYEETMQLGTVTRTLQCKALIPALFRQMFLTSCSYDPAAMGEMLLPLLQTTNKEEPSISTC